MKRRFVGAMLATALLAGTLSGCGGAKDDSSADGNVKLTFYCNSVVNNDTPDIIAAFNEQYPNIEVEYVELPADATKKNQTISTILQAKDDSMDVFLIDTTWPDSYTASGWLEPMDDVLTDEEKAEYMSGPIEACTIDGSLMALPVFMDTGVMLYRIDLLEKYGFEYPATWDEMAEQCKVIMEGEENVAGYVNSWKQYEALTCCALEYIKSYGGDIIDEDGNVVIDSDEAKAGLQEMYDSIYTDKITDEGINGYTTPDAAAIFNSGNAVFFRGWSSNYTEANNEEVSSVVGNVGVAPLPAGTDGSYSSLGGWAIGVSPYSANIEEAKLFAKFFSGAEANKIRALAGGYLPVINSVYEDAEVVEANPQFELLKACAETAVGRPKSIYYEEVSAAVQQGVGSILTGSASVEEAQATMKEQIQDIVDR